MLLLAVTLDATPCPNDSLAGHRFVMENMGIHLLLLLIHKDTFSSMLNGTVYTSYTVYHGQHDIASQKQGDVLIFPYRSPQGNPHATARNATNQLSSAPFKRRGQRHIL